MATIAFSDAARTTASIRRRFLVTIFVGAFLLFLVQPMIARMALPRLGGAPAVWNSSMLVYQALLLAGYAYAHLLGRLAAPRQVAVHIGMLVLAALSLPIGLSADVPGQGANPFLWVPWLLLISIGPLFFVISAQAPLMQRWYTLSGGSDPYPLYAASNLGSFSGLLAYPLLIEPFLPIANQRGLWSAAYLLLMILVLWCGRNTSDRTPPDSTEAVAPPDRRSMLMWMLLSAVPSGLILSTTLHLTTDIVAMPLLWVLPLGAYLLSYTIAFAETRWPARVISQLAPLTILVTVLAATGTQGAKVILIAALAILNLFCISVALHSRLFEIRPHPRHLTAFYLFLSLGGVIGGALCALAAPMLFDWTYEHPILLAAAAFLLPAPSPFRRFVDLWTGDRTARAMSMAGVVVVAVLAVGSIWTSGTVLLVLLLAIVTIGIFAIGDRLLFGAAVVALIMGTSGWDRLQQTATPGQLTRSFFGVHTVSGDDTVRVLTHGTTVHGIQLLGSPERERAATGYYGQLSGVGLAMRAAPAIFGRDASISIVGLGAGTLACYAQPGQHWTFYEIDPAIEQIARDIQRFTFLSNCLPGADVVIGDARLTLRDVSTPVDILVLDAFSSDSVPMHLLTTEAFEEYQRLLRPNGLLMVHITNRHLRLEPVIAGAAHNGKWLGYLRAFSPNAEQAEDGEARSLWVALSRDEETLNRLVQSSDQHWRPLRKTGAITWTDDHASLLPIIRWES